MQAPLARPISAVVLRTVHRLLGTPLLVLGRINGPAIAATTEPSLPRRTPSIPPAPPQTDEPEGLGAATFIVEAALGAESLAGRKYLLTETLAGRMIESGAPLFWPGEGDCAFERALGMGWGGLFPVVARDAAVIGAVCAYDVRVRSFPTEDIALAAALVALLARELEDTRDLDRAVEHERARLAGLLARGLAHDFGNIVASALANVRSLARIVANDPNAHEPLEEITSALEGGRELIARLRAVGRSDQMMKSRKGIDPAAIVSKVVGLARAVVETRDEGGRIDLKLASSPRGLEVRGDEYALEQAMLNLVLNARDAVASRGGHIVVRVVPKRVRGHDRDHPWLTPGDWVMLVVDDDGPGVERRDHDRIFEPGFTTKGERGMGLGLFIVRTTAAAHGGGVIVDRSPEGGARMAMCVPLVGSGGLARNEPPHSEALVLVADDERGLRRACARELVAAGFSVAEAGSRATAMEIVEADPGRIVAAIVDRDLGDGSGEDVANRIRELNPGALVIETSGASDLILKGRTAVLEKPFDLPSLVERIIAATRTT